MIYISGGGKIEEVQIEYEWRPEICRWKLGKMMFWNIKSNLCLCLELWWLEGNQLQFSYSLWLVQPPQLCIMTS